MTGSPSSIRRYHEVQRVLCGVLALNVFVALAKLSYGLLSHSLSMQADGFHSLFDGVSNMIGIAGLWLAAKPPDASHPYGHKKFEMLATAGIGLMLVGTSLYLLWQTSQAFMNRVPPQVTGISFGVMIVTMTINFGVTKWERKKGKELKSDILIADSYHTASDLFTSLTVLVGLLAVRLGYPILDPIVAILVVLVIAWTALKVFKEVIRSLVDGTQLNPEAVRSIVLATPGVLDCHAIRTRGLANHVFVDLSIHVEPHLTIEAAHQLAHQVEDSLRSQFSSVEDVIIHFEPEGHT